MNKHMNKILVVALSFVFMLSQVCFASTNFRYLTQEEISSYDKFDINESNIDNLRKTQIVDASEKVYDFADLFTDDEEVKIYNEIKNYIDKTQMDFAVVTLKDVSASDYTDMVYADDFYDYNDFGIGQTRDGMLMIIDIRNDVAGNRYVYYSTCGNAILIYDDDRINNLVNTFVYGSEITNDYEPTVYANGVINAILDAENYAELGIPSSNRDAWIDENGDYHYESGHARKMMSPIERIIDSLGIVIIITLIATIIFYCINSGKLKNKKKATSANLYLKDGSLNFSRKEDRFISTHTTSYRMSSDSSSGGGGSSSHSSSSGSSHGGGGGHF